tara:strand:+ start:2187 stop:2306 length:120 start_codon:yes stop_codon:yes gene_type:complete
MRQLTQKIINTRYSKLEFEYVKPMKIKIPYVHESAAEKT